MATPQSDRAHQGWHTAHTMNFGEQRWHALHEALHREVEHLCFLNPFLPASAKETLIRDYCLEPTLVKGTYSFDIPEDPIKHFRTAALGDEHSLFVEVSRGVPESYDVDLGGMSPFLFIEGSSAIVAAALRPDENDKVLDVCGAPGGKAAVLASAMFAVGSAQEHAWPMVRGRLVCNEFSKERAARMQRALREFLPPVLYDESHAHGPHIVFTSADAGTSHNSMERNGPYDKILLDAPCISDRQLLRDGDTGELGRWSSGKVKVSAKKLLKLAQHALWLLKEGGVLLYCVISLSHEECDGLIETLLIQTRSHFVLEIIPLEEDIRRMVPGLASEDTAWGTQIFPDRTPFGPVYFSRLRLVKRIHESVVNIPHI